MKTLGVLVLAAVMAGTLAAAEEPAKLRKVQTTQTLQADAKAHGFGGGAFGKILGEYLQGKIKIAGGKQQASEILDHITQGQSDFATPQPEKNFSGVAMTLQPGTYLRGELMDMIAIAESGEFRLTKEGRIVFRQAAEKKSK